MMKDYSKRFWAKVKVTDENDCWEWQAHRDRKGYGKFQIKNSVPAHRVAWELTNGPIPKGKMVCHTCDNPPCCNPKHLFLGTNNDNMQDMVRKGRSSRGLNRPLVKLSPEIVIEARRLYHQELLSVAEIAGRLGVNAGTLRAAINGRSWAWVAEEVARATHTMRSNFSRRAGHRGINNGRCKLKPEDILTIRADIKGGATQRSIADRFGVSDSTINAILTGQNWAWLKEEETT